MITETIEWHDDLVNDLPDSNRTVIIAVPVKNHVRVQKAKYIGTWFKGVTGKDYIEIEKVLGWAEVPKGPKLNKVKEV